jgi:hypothetical protein
MSIFKAETRRRAVLTLAVAWFVLLGVTVVSACLSGY